jgi:hypothetical protein
MFDVLSIVRCFSNVAEESLVRRPELLLDFVLNWEKDKDVGPHLISKLTMFLKI